MSRVYITASMKHTSLGISLPTLSVETADHTGGSYNVKGVHIPSLAAAGGQGPEVKKGQRFDYRFNINAQRAAVGMCITTSKFLPHIEWSSENGLGKLPLGSVVPILLANTRSSSTKPPVTKPEKNHEKGEAAAVKSQSGRSQSSRPRERYYSPERRERRGRRGRESDRESDHNRREVSRGYDERSQRRRRNDDREMKNGKSRDTRAIPEREKRGSVYDADSEEEDWDRERERYPERERMGEKVYSAYEDRKFGERRASGRGFEQDSGYGSEERGFDNEGNRKRETRRRVSRRD